MKKMRYFGKCINMLLISIVFCSLNGCVVSVDTHDKQKKSIGENNKRTVDHTKIKAEQGNARAQYALGRMYYYGKEVKQDYKGAFKWFEKSAKQGNAKAQYALGVMYYYGKEVKQDYKEAFKWFDKSAQQENAKAQFALGRMYYLGRGVQQDYNKAINWIEKAAKQGDPVTKTPLDKNS